MAPTPRAPLGAEGSIEEFVDGHHVRRCRYRGLAKTHVRHVLTALASNVGALSGPPSRSRLKSPPAARIGSAAHSCRIRRPQARPCVDGLPERMPRPVLSRWMSEGSARPPQVKSASTTTRTSAGPHGTGTSRSRSPCSLGLVTAVGDVPCG
ncbi:transposase [Streptomyces sp. NPDC059696]|uniref:transposase n=1 Tax=Streptomyces sp. NPDC059696 TaxID=3346911 RepID=UPI0036977D1A